MSKNIFGMHDPGDWTQIIRDAGREAWCVFTVEVGHNPDETHGQDFAVQVGPNITPIVRINNGYAGGGTIPTGDQYKNFAQRCANFVAASRGCKHWVIGNEIAMAWEWPNNQPIKLDNYVECFAYVRNAIKAVQPDAIVCPQAPAPYNNQLTYNGNPLGDWVQQLADMLIMIGVGNVDGIALHTYTHGHDATLIASEAMMNAPFDRKHFNFRAYQDFMNVIPTYMRDLPVFITESNPDGWQDTNNGWVQLAYREIDDWNHNGNQQIRCLALYRWPQYDREKFWISTKRQVINDFAAALSFDYRWQSDQPTQISNPDFSAGVTAVTAESVRLRSTPAGMTIGVLAPGVSLKILGFSQGVSGLIWWPVETKIGIGWIAQADRQGLTLIKLPDAPAPDPLSTLASEYGLDVQLARAVIAVESSGHGFVNGRLIMRFEPHVFLGYLSDADKYKFNAYFQVGAPAWDGAQHRLSLHADGNYQTFHGNQDLEWRALEVAISINEGAAYQSASYGLGQIMGFNYGICGYANAQAMVEAFKTNETAQIRAMFEYFKNRQDRNGVSALSKLQGGDFVGFANLYNGPANASSYAVQIRNQL